MSDKDSKGGELMVTLTRDDLRVLLREEVAAAVKDALEPTRQRWVNIEAAAEHAGVTTRTIRRWIEIGLVATQLGRDYRLRISDLDAWLEQHRAGKLQKVG